MAPTASPNAPFTIRSTHRVSQPPTERDTISVPVTLAHAASTSRPPATAATSRPANGITMGSPPRPNYTWCTAVCPCRRRCCDDCAGEPPVAPTLRRWLCRAPPRPQARWRSSPARTAVSAWRSSGNWRPAEPRRYTRACVLRTTWRMNSAACPWPWRSCRHGQGRAADVYALDADRVLRRYRTPYSCAAEADLMRYLRRVGYPVPTVLAVDGGDLVMRNDIVMDTAVGQIARKGSRHRPGQCPERLVGPRRKPDHLLAEPRGRGNSQSKALTRREPEAARPPERAAVCDARVRHLAFPDP